MHGLEQETEGLKRTLDLLIEKKNQLSRALAIAYDEEKKFALQKQLQELEAEIKAIREQLEDLTRQGPPGATLPETPSGLSASKPGNTSSKKIFFSYSKHDREYLDQLLRHLSGLKREGRIKPWDDSHILPGEEWDDKVKQELAAADIILLLVSADFLATDYIWEVEIKEAMERHEQGTATVIPVIIRSCSWNKLVFGKLNGLPAKGVPVSTLKDRDEAWLEVVKGIERVL